VTASGKTEVYLHAVEHALSLGRGALVLVPEIALTPQLVARFRARLGDAIAVVHSALGEVERQTMWQGLRRGTLRVAVGARSALFAPVENLGLICVDEEHDPSFKQEEGVRYNARDMALFRAHRASGICVLGSATPSLASEYAAREGRIGRLLLPNRALSNATLPEVELVDLRRMGPGPSGDRLLTVPLLGALEDVLLKREQAILFLNRRGFAPSLVCDDCGKVVRCPDCSVSLTLHRARRPELVCHYCDYVVPPPSTCPACKGARLTEEGAGTERIEQSLQTLFPQARIARLDRDVASGSKSEKVMERMRRGDIDVLVGTQMVTKGHDLPRVTLVGVLDADAALSLPDFRAAERTFQLLVQVAGRAGRADIRGRVLIQTRQPEEPAIVHAVHHDVDAFLAHELLGRAELGYPPYARLGLVRCEAISESVAEKESERLARLARAVAPASVNIVGPAPAPVSRIRSRYRFRFLARSSDRRALRAVLLEVLRAPRDRRLRLLVDVDPMNML
jgi:primosomal protein N' (replication factor Y) (superfamily II helicase)